MLYASIVHKLYMLKIRFFNKLALLITPPQPKLAYFLCTFNEHGDVTNHKKISNKQTFQMISSLIKVQVKRQVHLLMTGADIIASNYKAVTD